jgi:hypothetical protein
MLQDYHRARAGREAEPFSWPKYNLLPYYSQGDIRPVGDGPIAALPDDAERDQVQIFAPPPLPDAVLRAIPLKEAVVPNAPTHVRNFEYDVRWLERPHSENSTVPYDRVWSTPAFAEFISGSNLTGHVPPQQFEREHTRQVVALAAGSVQPNAAVPLANPQEQAQALRNYNLSQHPARRIQSLGIQRAASLPPLRGPQSQGSQPPR